MAYIPYGYKVEDGRAVIDPEEKERLMRFFTLFLEHHPLCECVRESGVERSDQGAKQLFSKRQYLGTDFYPPMITHDLFNRLQHELRRREALHAPYETHARIISPPVYTSFTCELLSAACSQDHHALSPTELYNSIRPVNTTVPTEQNQESSEKNQEPADAGQKGALSWQ